MRFLVTAGGTREPIDAVRDWGNVFTGATGLAIAQSLAAEGTVDLLTSNQRHLEAIRAGDNPALNAAGFGSHRELRQLIESSLASTHYDGIFMTAAVADYEPTGAYAVLSRAPTGTPGEERWIVRDVHAAKIKSTHSEIAVRADRTQKIIDLFRAVWNYRGLLVKFKLEVGISREELIRVGEASRLASHADYLVANTLAMTTGSGAGAFLLGDDACEWVERAELPDRLRRLALQHINASR